MATALLARNRNFRLLFSAGAFTNLGDGLVLLALPWLATMMTDNALLIGAVAASGTLPWLLFAIPAGVITDRVDRRKLIARADLMRSFVALAILLLALQPNADGAIWVLAALAFLLGSAEVIRDNTAQTILPSIVDAKDLEKANGQLWSTEQLTGQFIGPPLAGVLIAAGIAIPFGLHAAFLALAAGLVWMITLQPTIGAQARFGKALLEGIAFMRGDTLLLRLAIVLGIANFIATGTLTIQVLFAQEVLKISSAAYGVLLSAGAMGAIAGSLTAPQLTKLCGVQTCLLLSIGGWVAGYTTIGLTSQSWVMGLSLFGIMFSAMLWNVITVSWRQRRIPTELLGRVNSIYRFFGWGSMPLGALAGGFAVSMLEDDLGREMAIRAPFVLAGLCCVGILVYAVFKLRLD